MKVSKEAMAGLWTALDLFLETDHDADYLVHKSQLESLAESMAKRSDVRFHAETDWDIWPAPIIRIWPTAKGCKLDAVRSALLAHDPIVHINVEHGGLMINTHCLQPGEIEVVVSSLNAALDAATSV